MTWNLGCAGSTSASPGCSSIRPCFLRAMMLTPPRTSAESFELRKSMVHELSRNVSSTRSAVPETPTSLRFRSMRPRVALSATSTSTLRSIVGTVLSAVYLKTGSATKTTM